MSQLEIELAYPLRWPAGRPRTNPDDRKSAAWRHEGRRITLATANRRLRDQLSAMTRHGKPWRTSAHVLTCNIRFTRSGARDQNFRREPEDVGVAVYFELDRKPMVLACDRWDTVQDNLAAIAAHIEALRGQERWGVADLAQAFAGHAALAPPGGTPSDEPWWQVLGVSKNASVFEIEAAWRNLIFAAHPDQGGSHAQAARVNRARDQGRAANGTQGS